jgi:thiol-disulfide isomerase/thioredoxin
MKMLSAATLLAVLVATTSAQEAKQEPKKIIPNPPQKKVEITLKVGDAPPPLKATKWLQGDAVSAFAAGKVYVVEFWATWCGPCIVMMPHMSDLQTEYKSKGVTIVGFSAKDANNSEDKVTAFVKKRGPSLKYTFAYADDRETNEAWMRAAGRNGIPCCFVVGKDTKIAWIGHPMFLDVVLPKVVDGTWNIETSNAEIEKVEQAYGAMSKAMRGEPEAGVKALAEFETKYPSLKFIPYHQGPKLSMFLKAKKFPEAKKCAEELITRATKQEDPTVFRTVSSVLRGPDAKDEKDLLTLSVNAAEAGLKLAGDKDALMVLNAAESYFAAGNAAKAKEYAEKALTAAEAESAALKNFVTQQTKRLLAKEEEKKKDE